MTRWEGLIRRARERRGFTQYQVADMLGVSQASIWYAEHTPRPTLTNLERFAAVLGYRLEVRLVDVAEPDREDIA